MLNDAGTAGNTVLTMSATNDTATGVANGTNTVQFNNSGASNGIRVGIGLESPDCPLYVGNVTGVTAGTLVFHLSRPTLADNLLVYASDAYAVNAAAATMKIGSISSTNRSINATGTINALGTDYGEYIQCSHGVTLSAGEVCGIDSSGMLTSIYENSIRFVVVSTNPSFVGGDGFNPGSTNNIDNSTKKQLDLNTNRPTSEVSITIDDKTKTVKGQPTSYTSDYFDFITATPPSENTTKKETISITTSTGTYCIVSFCGRIPVTKSSINSTYQTTMKNYIGSYLVVDKDTKPITVSPISSDSLTMQQFLTSIGQIISVDPAGIPTIIVRQ